MSKNDEVILRNNSSPLKSTDEPGRLQGRDGSSMVRFWSLLLILLLSPLHAAASPTGGTTPFTQKMAQDIPLLLDNPRELQASIEERLKNTALSLEDRQAYLLTLLHMALVIEDLDLAQATLPKIRALVQDGTVPYGWFLALDAQSQDTLARDADVFAQLKKAEQIARRFKDSYLLVQVLGQQSTEAADSFRPQEALSKLQEADEHLQNMPEDEDWTLLHRQNIASYYNQVGDRNRLALDTQQSILTAVEQRGRYRFFKHILWFNLALNHMKTENNEKCLQGLKEALAWARSINDSVSMALTHQALAMTYQNLSRIDEALSEAHEARRKFETLSTPHRRYWNSMVLAELYMVKNNIEEAERFAQEARHWLEQSKYHRDEYPYLEFMANLSTQKLQYKKSSELWRELYFKRYESIGENDRRLSQKLNAEFELQKLENRNALQEKELKESARQRIYLMIGVLACSVIIAVLMRSRVQDKIIKKQKEHIQGILDSIQEGIVRCNAQGLIQSGHSKQLESLLEEGEDLASRSLFDCLIAPSALQGDEKERIRQTLAALLNEEELAWELNAAQLPGRLPYKGKFLNVSWQPLWDHNRCVTGLQLVIRDDTHEEQLKHEVLKEKSRQDFLQRLWQELASQNFARATECIRETRQWLASCLASGAKPDGEGKRHWHTLKGNARSLGLKNLAAEIHLIEDGVHEASTYPKPLLRSLDSLLSQYESLFMSMMTSTAPTHDSILSLCDRIFKDIRQRYPQLEQRLWQIEFLDSWQDWTSELMRVMEAVFNHALNNAVDHGYIRPEAGGREAHALIFKIETLRSTEGLFIRIWDRGAGIQWAKLEKIAQARGWIYHNREELAQILWEDAVSTADQVSISSGRGMGLAALRELVETRHGSIVLSDRDDGQSGTCLTLTIPVQATLKSA